MKAFPAPGKGMTRYVLPLPKEENEDALKIELVIGKTVQLEPNNHYFFAGKVEIKVAQGWGFNYYVLPKLGPMAGTLMAVDSNAHDEGHMRWLFDLFKTHGTLNSLPREEMDGFIAP